MSENTIANTITVSVKPLCEDTFAPFGWMLGCAFPGQTQTSAFSNTATDFWTQHVFQTGSPEGTEILWVNYRNKDLTVTHLEKHLLTEQAIVPLTGSIIQLMACSSADGAVDPTTATAFIIHPGQGICMRPGAWHATRSIEDEVTCLMLTRASTTIDLVSHLRDNQHSQESAIVEIPRHELIYTAKSDSP